MGEMMIEADPKTQETQSLTFSQAINSCYKKTLTLRGCTSRDEYWRFFLFNIVFWVGFSVLVPLDLYELAELLINLGWTVTLLALNTATVRRLHDIGRSGWWWWILPISLAPLVIFGDNLLLQALAILGFAQLIMWLAMPSFDKEKEKEKVESGSWKE